MLVIKMGTQVVMVEKRDINYLLDNGYVFVDSVKIILRDE